MSHSAIGVYERTVATANAIGAYDLEPSAEGGEWMDGSMTEEEWWNWRRRMFRQRMGWSYARG
jgi:hypothetical protein